MTTNAQSAYEIHQAESRAQQERSAETASLVRRHRADVEDVILTEGRANHIAKLNSEYDADEAFRERVAEDRSQWRCRGMLLAAVVVYVAGEFFASGDVADTLARQIAPLFDLPPTMSETPVWLRRIAGYGFVGIMLFATLGIKYAAALFCENFEAAKARAAVGQHSVFWKNTLGIWTAHLAKVAYLVAVAFLYFWLYGFAQDRAALNDPDKEEEAPTAPIKFERGAVVAAQPPVENSEAPKKPGIGSRLGMATGVLYICLWVLHSVLLVLPVNGRELEYAHFKRGVNERKVQTMREKQGRVVRDILERIHSVEGEHRDVLLRETQPIVHIVNREAGYDAMDVPPAPAGAAQQAQNAAPVPTPTTPEPTAAAPTSTDFTPAQEPQDAYEAIFGNRAA